MTGKKVVSDVTPLVIARSYLSTEDNKTGSWRFLRPCYKEKTAPCSVACPAGEDIGRIEALTNQGFFKEAWETILRENPFPGVCGSVCYHPCEEVCNRGEFDEAVAINVIERFLAETARKNDFRPFLTRLSAKKERVAVVGGGPSGLAAAYFLTLLGYNCDVFEATAEPGGVLRWGIPQYRLPLSVLERDISLIEDQGVQIKTGVHISKEFLKETGNLYNALFIGCGYSRSRKLEIPGEDLKGIEDGLAFLKRIRHGERPRLDGLSVIIGGGNTAIDVARSVVRLGGTPIIAYRRRRQDMPAFADEITMALDEDVGLRELVVPVSIVPDKGEYIITLHHMKIVGEDDNGRALVKPDGKKAEKMRVRNVFKAIGEEGAESWCDPPHEGEGIVHLNNSVVDCRTENTALVFGGDLANKTKSVVHAIASGKEAAIALDILFREGRDSLDSKLEDCLVGNGSFCSMEIYINGDRVDRSSHVVSYSEINTDYFYLSQRITQPRLMREERLATFDEVDLKISASMAIRETERCFNCGICNQCDNCYLFCPDLSIVRDKTPQGRHINYDYCKGCGICVVECPRNAMVLEEEINEACTGGESGGS